MSELFHYRLLFDTNLGYSLKKSCMSEKEVLGETGAGLVETEEGKGNIWEGSPLANIWCA